MIVHRIFFYNLDIMCSEKYDVHAKIRMVNVLNFMVEYSILQG